MDVVGSRVRMVLAGVFLVGLTVGFLCEVPVFHQAFFPKKTKSISQRIKQVRKKCAKEFPLRTGFVTLNGGLVRLIGQHLCNGVVRMGRDNLLLDPSDKRQEMKPAAESAAKFAHYCEKQGARYLCVLLPKKLNVSADLLPPGEKDAAYANADDLRTGLMKRGVEVLDWRSLFAATSEDVGANFFRTDHHWNIDAAFKAASHLAKEVAVRGAVDNRVREEVERLLSEESWSRQVYPGLFLGSLGKRTGPWYAGLDDFAVRRPKFDTQMSISIPSKSVFREGSFEETVMWHADALESPGNLYERACYSMAYVGGLYSFVRHDNPKAPLNMRVLVVGDSYARPLEGFLSVVVRRLDFVDPRRCGRDFKLSRFVARERPDMVIQIQNPSSLIAHSMVGVKSKLPIMFEYGLSNYAER